MQSHGWSATPGSSDSRSTVDLPHTLYLVTAAIDESTSEAEFNRWYEVHVPALLGVPGIVSATRYQQLGAPRRYLAAYEIDGVHVFDEPAYRSATGFGPWRSAIESWRAGVYALEYVRGGGG